MSLTLRTASAKLQVLPSTGATTIHGGKLLDRSGHRSKFLSSSFFLRHRRFQILLWNLVSSKGEARMSDQLDRDIDEILQHTRKKSSSESQRPNHDWRIREPYRKDSLFRKLPVKTFFIGSGCLFLAGLILNAFGSGISGIVFWIGLIAFVLGYLLLIARARNSPDLTWRGRPVDYGTSSSLLTRVRRWFQS